MMTLSLNNLVCSEALDRKSMAELTGGERVLDYAVIYNGPWVLKSLTSQNQGLAFHDGYLSRHMLTTMTRSRVQTEYSYWHNFVRM